MMNTAIEQAKALYAAHGLNLARDLGLFLEHGVVIALPNRLLLGRPIALADPDRWAEETPHQVNAWLVHFACGRGAVRWFFEQMPWTLPYVAWRRGFHPKPDERLRIYPTAALKRRLF